jgi:hypothetical protein
MWPQGFWRIQQRIIKDTATRRRSTQAHTLTIGLL